MVLLSVEWPVALLYSLPSSSPVCFTGAAAAAAMTSMATSTLIALFGMGVTQTWLEAPWSLRTISSQAREGPCPDSAHPHIVPTAACDNTVKANHSLAEMYSQESRPRRHRVLITRPPRAPVPLPIPSRLVTAVTAPLAALGLLSRTVRCQPKNERRCANEGMASALPPPLRRSRATSYSTRMAGASLSTYLRASHRRFLQATIQSLRITSRWVGNVLLFVSSLALIGFMDMDYSVGRWRRW